MELFKKDAQVEKRHVNTPNLCDSPNTLLYYCFTILVLFHFFSNIHVHLRRATISYLCVYSFDLYLYVYTRKRCIRATRSNSLGSGLMRTIFKATERRYIELFVSLYNYCTSYDGGGWVKA